MDALNMPETDLLKIYGLASCDRCRQAKRTLRAAGVRFEFIDVRADGIETDKLARLVRQLGDAVINRRSATWRGLTGSERQAAPVALLAAHPALMKRPVIERDGRFHPGWSIDVLTAMEGLPVGPDARNLPGNA